MVALGLQDSKLQSAVPSLALACVTFADVLWTEASHMAKARVKVGGD